MATETVTLPREELEEVRLDLATAIDSIVAIQEICKAGNDGLSHGLVHALELCNITLEDLVGNSRALVGQWLGEGHV